jgi:sigma-B regulation protein RsbU (phosphoserine phosphatase)
MEDQNIVLNLQKQLFTKNMEVNSLLEITQAINNNVSYGELFRIYEFILRAQLRLSKLVLIAQPEEQNQWKVGSMHGLEFALTNSMIDDLRQVNEVLAVKEIESKQFGQFQHIIPVFNNGFALAYVLVEKGKVEEINKEELQFIETLTNVVVVAIENQKLFKQQLGQERMKREMELAGEIQRMLIPDVLPSQKGIQMASMYQPHSEVGGDYFDVFDINDNEIVFCIGDISGKGISAALLMSNFQANLRALVYQEPDLVQLINTLNERFTKITNSERFITFFIAKYNKQTHKMEYVSCGHNPTYIANVDKVEPLTTGCTLLGMFDELPIVNLGETEVKEESLLFLYTDGIIDVVNDDDEHYEEERLEEFLQKNVKTSANDVSTNLMKEINEYRNENPYPDDVTYLAIKLR